MQNGAVCVNEYFNDYEIKENQDKSSEDPIYKGYKAVLDSKSTDETLVSSCFINVLSKLALQNCLWLM